MHTGKLTKIIATIGPSSESEHILKELILNGVNIFRFNTKHNTNEWHMKNIGVVHKLSADLGINTGVLVDLQGPEIRIDTFEGSVIPLEKHDEIIFTNDFELNEVKLKKEHKYKDITFDTTKEYPKTRMVRIVQKEIFKTLEEEDRFSIDDGFMEFEITESHKSFFIAKALDEGPLKNRKGLNLVEKDVDLPSLTENDIERIHMAAKVKVDYLAISFVRTANDIEELKKVMDKAGLKAKIISKIESQKGVENINEILEVCDGIMIARGDLGIEIPIERVTSIQKDIIKKCRNKGKPVIVATQMLQSMTEAPRPTRAEAADVANAVYDGTDCVMLSGETASGKCPVKSVDVMRRILKYNENKSTLDVANLSYNDQTHLIVKAAMTIVEHSKDQKIDKIIVFTETGLTARILSSFRAKVPVIAISDNPKTVGSLTMSYGIAPIYMKLPSEEIGYPKELIKELHKSGGVNEGERILIIHGKKWKEPGGTNALVLVTI